MRRGDILTNIHDSKTLQEVLTKASLNREKPIKEAICDRGYRGQKEINSITISIPDTKRKKRDSRYKIEQKRNKFRRRAAIVFTSLRDSASLHEPIIEHLKSDYRLSRNYLKGFIGGEQR